MWKLILSALFFLSASCFAFSESAKFSNQVSLDQWLTNQELEEVSEDTLVVTVDQLEDVIEELNRAKHSKSKHVRILFVNNTNPKPGNGSYKNPFSTLLAAQQASKKGDIIFVFPGDNTTKGMNQGFVMKNDQRLLGAGVHHKIDFPEKKLVVHAFSTTLPRITNTSGNVITLANSCEVSGINIVDISNFDGIVGGDSNIGGPQRLGIKNTLIRKNVIGTFQRDQSFVLNGAIYLANCRGELIVKDNFILNILGLAQEISGKGIHVLNKNLPVSSHVIITGNIVSNTGAAGITLSHSSPKGKVKGLIEDNIVFNIGQIEDGILAGTQGTDAGGHLHVKLIKNFCENVHLGFNIHVQSSGIARVKALVKDNVVARSGVSERGIVFPGIVANSFDSSHICLKLVKNFSEFGYLVRQEDFSHFNLEPPHKNLGLPFMVEGNIKLVHAGKCGFDSHSDPDSEPKRRHSFPNTCCPGDD